MELVGDVDDLQETSDAVDEDDEVNFDPTREEISGRCRAIKRSTGTRCTSGAYRGTEDQLCLLHDDAKDVELVNAEESTDQTALVDGGAVRDHPDDSKCAAIVRGSGKQCRSNAEDLCGQHEGMRRLLRVDEVDGAPLVDLRDELIDVGASGYDAYRLAAEFDTPEAMWHASSGYESRTVAGEAMTADWLSMRAHLAADLLDNDPHPHPFLFDSCIAISDSSVYDDGRCRSGGHSARLTCGVHDGAKNLRTVFDEGEKYANAFTPCVADMTDALLVEWRADGEEAIVIVEDGWGVFRMEAGVVVVNEQEDVDAVKAVAADGGERPDLPAYLLDPVESDARTPDELRALAAYAEALADDREAAAEAEATQQDDANEDGDSAREKPDRNEEREADLRADRPDDVPSGAGLVMKHINGNWYYYWQYREPGKETPTQDYAGAVNPKR
ncbi:hypothetical protein [Halomarina oriensis]|uniref:hypothetical protein n=1 Tax=Halomarina oriensis TaxID=671145 RepID=UPI001E2D01C8|nr:hypothetical protein [Halomarina oriensis]